MILHSNVNTTPLYPFLLNSSACLMAPQWGVIASKFARFFSFFLSISGCLAALRGEEGQFFARPGGAMVISLMAFWGGACLAIAPLRFRVLDNFLWSRVWWGGG